MQQPVIEEKIVREKTFKALIIGVVASVLGGIFLLYGTEYIVKPFLWLKSAILWSWNFLISSHSLPGWVLLIVFLFASLFIIFAVIYFLVKIDKNSESKHLLYTKDIMFGAIWRWKWMGNQISNIWCYCPYCDTMLVYDEHWGETYFRCENCNNSVIATFDCSKNRAIRRVAHQIDRKLRSGEFRKIITSNQ